MKSIQVLIDQGKVCREFALANPAEVAKKGFTAQDTKELGVAIATLEQSSVTRQGAGEEADEASGQVAAATAVATEKLRLAYIAFRLVKRKAKGKQRIALAGVFKLKPVIKVGAAKLVTALKAAASAGSKANAAAALKVLAGWTAEDRKVLTSLATELDQDRSQRGKAVGTRKTVVKQIKQAAAVVEDAIEAFKLTVELACADDPGVLDAFFQALRAAEAVVHGAAKPKAPDEKKAAKKDAAKKDAAPDAGEEKKVG